MKTIGIKEIFSNTVDRAGEIEKEINRLSEIESRFKESLDTITEEVKGLEKALSYSTIKSTAALVLKDIVKQKQSLANDYCWRLGIAKIYSDK